MKRLLFLLTVAVAAPAIAQPQSYQGRNASFLRARLRSLVP